MCQIYEFMLISSLKFMLIKHEFIFKTNYLTCIIQKLYFISRYSTYIKISTKCLQLYILWSNSKDLAMRSLNFRVSLPYYIITNQITVLKKLGLLIGRLWSMNKILNVSNIWSLQIGRFWSSSMKLNLYWYHCLYNVWFVICYCYFCY